MLTSAIAESIRGQIDQLLTLEDLLALGRGLFQHARQAALGAGGVDDQPVARREDFRLLDLTFALLQFVLLPGELGLLGRQVGLGLPLVGLRLAPARSRAEIACCTSLWSWRI